MSKNSLIFIFWVTIGQSGRLQVVDLSTFSGFLRGVGSFSGFGSFGGFGGFGSFGGLHWTPLDFMDLGGVLHPRSSSRLILFNAFFSSLVSLHERSCPAKLTSKERLLSSNKPEFAKRPSTHVFIKTVLKKIQPHVTSPKICCSQHFFGFHLFFIFFSNQKLLSQVPQCGQGILPFLSTGPLHRLPGFLDHGFF